MPRPNIRQPVWAIGLGVFLLLFVAAAWSGMSYYTAKSEFCISCHVMKPMYEAAYHSAHRLDGNTCGDCHVPTGVVSKAVYEATSGMKHMFYFYSGQSPDVIQITEGDARIVNQNCLRCHSAVMREVKTAAGGPQCTDCHRSTPHNNI